MVGSAVSKRALNSARTREKLIDAAVALYGNSSMDAVSLREIAVEAGQKNPNALQYHFGGRDGLLQAIVDKHSARIGLLREEFILSAENEKWSPGETAARCLVMPIIHYMEHTDDGVNFIKLVSQIAAVYQNGTASGPSGGVTFPRTASLEAVFNRALSALSPKEAQRRIYLVVTITFHTLADIYATREKVPASAVTGRQLMAEQLICLLESFFSAFPRQHV
ncbi:MAG: TetR family transcriptional regulator [Halioglobus sp.]